MLSQGKTSSHWKVRFDYDPMVLDGFKRTVPWNLRKWIDPGDGKPKFWMVIRTQEANDYIGDFITWARNRNHKVKDSRQKPFQYEYNFRDYTYQQHRQYEEGQRRWNQARTRTQTNSSGWAAALFDRVGPDKVKSIYRSMSRVLHPDVGGDPELFDELTKEYEKHEKARMD